MDDVGDCVVMASSWLLPSKVAVVEPGSFVDPTTITGSPCLTSLSLFLFLHLVLALFTSSPFCSACSFESVISPRFSLFRPSLGVFVPSFLRLLVAPLILSGPHVEGGTRRDDEVCYSSAPLCLPCRIFFILSTISVATLIS